LEIDFLQLLYETKIIDRNQHTQFERIVKQLDDIKFWLNLDGRMLPSVSKQAASKYSL